AARSLAPSRSRRTRRSPGTGPRLGACAAQISGESSRLAITSCSSHPKPQNCRRWSMAISRRQRGSHTWKRSAALPFATNAWRRERLLLQLQRRELPAELRQSSCPIHPQFRVPGLHLGFEQESREILDLLLQFRREFLDQLLKSFHRTASAGGEYIAFYVCATPPGMIASCGLSGLRLATPTW